MRSARARRSTSTASSSASPAGTSRRAIMSAASTPGGRGSETGPASHRTWAQNLMQLRAAGFSSTAPQVITVQECGGIGKTVDAGVKAIAELLPRVNDVKRVKLSADRLILGT